MGKNKKYKVSVEEGCLVREGKKIMIYGPEYCGVCGLRNVAYRDEGGIFDVKTGKPIFRTYCPNNPCRHTRHRWDQCGGLNHICLTCGKESGITWAFQ